MKKNITELTSIIRSKNSGPYELTLDIMFSSEENYRLAIRENVINEELICRLYRITPDRIIGIILFEPAFAIKVTIARPICSGDLGETDVYGAQQHAPLLSVQVDVPETAG